MNRILFFLFLIIFSSASFGQTPEDSTDQINPPNETFLSEPVQHGIHGVLLLKSASFGPAQKNSLLVSGEIAWVLNKKHLLGFHITGLSTDVKAPDIFPVQGLNLVCNYGGFIIGYIHNSRRLIHIEGQSLFGVGQAFYRDAEYRAKYDDNDIFIIFEPSANAVLNITSSFRMTAGLSYRIASRVDLIGLQNEDLSGLSFNLGFKVGRF